MKPLFATVALLVAANVLAQTQPPLDDYVGTYEYGPGRTIEIVNGDGLFAVLDGAKYRLSPAGVDVVTNRGGQKIPFRRDESGNVTGFVESGKFFLRLSPTITKEAAALAHPRPAGRDSPADYRYHPPADGRDGIPVGDIAGTELGQATADAIVRGVLDGTYKDVHSVLLFQHGKLVMEEYFYGYSAARTHQLRSATKSIVSTLAGIAIDRGDIAGANERVLPSMTYADYRNPDRRKAEITLSDFLSMSSGLDCDDHSATSPGRETLIDETPDWVKATLDLPMIHNPGSKGFYCSGGVSVVGRMIENESHMKLPDFAQANLFGPLGISRDRWTWNYELTNANKEFSQIHLRPRDMLKIGMLYAAKGRWQGRQVLSAAWTQAALAEHSQVDNTGYGYFWWRPWLNVPTSAGDRRVDYIAAQGNGGQKIYLLPQYDFIAVFTAGDYNSEGAPPNRIMRSIILPVLLAAHPQQ
jgi:CubicO group peptidase (beta-lactamase class C family)